MLVSHPVNLWRKPDQRPDVPIPQNAKTANAHRKAGMVNVNPHHFLRLVSRETSLTYHPNSCYNVNVRLDTLCVNSAKSFIFRMLN